MTDVAFSQRVRLPNRPRRRDPPFPMLLIAIGNGGVLLGARGLPARRG